MVFFQRRAAISQLHRGEEAEVAYFGVYEPNAEKQENPTYYRVRNQKPIASIVLKSEAYWPVLRHQ